jgi:hypothetical protein
MIIDNQEATEVVDMGGVGAADQNLTEILARNLNAEVPVALRAMFAPDERALVVFPSTFGAIVATDRRVLLERPRRPTIVYRLSDLTGVVAHVGLASRYLALMGTGLPEKIGFGRAGTSSSATLVQAWQVGAARLAAAEMSRLIAAANQGVIAVGS